MKPFRSEVRPAHQRWQRWHFSAMCNDGWCSMSFHSCIAKTERRLLGTDQHEHGFQFQFICCNFCQDAVNTSRALVESVKARKDLVNLIQDISHLQFLVCFFGAFLLEPMWIPSMSQFLRAWSPMSEAKTLIQISLIEYFRNFQNSQDASFVFLVKELCCHHFCWDPEIAEIPHHSAILRKKRTTTLKNSGVLLPMQTKGSWSRYHQKWRLDSSGFDSYYCIMAFKKWYAFRTFWIYVFVAILGYAFSCLIMHWILMDFCHVFFCFLMAFICLASPPHVRPSRSNLSSWLWRCRFCRCEKNPAIPMSNCVFFSGGVLLGNGPAVTFSTPICGVRMRCICVKQKQFQFSLFLHNNLGFWVFVSRWGLWTGECLYSLHLFPRHDSVDAFVSCVEVGYFASRVFTVLA